MDYKPSIVSEKEYFSNHGAYNSHTYQSKEVMMLGNNWSHFDSAPQPVIDSNETEELIKNIRLI